MTTTVFQCAIIHLTLLYYLCAAVYAEESQPPLKGGFCSSRLNVPATDCDHEFYHQHLFANSHGIVMSLPDGAFTASASYNDNYGPQYVRLGATAVPGCSHGWCTVNPPQNNYLTIDLGTSHIVTGIEIAGRGSSDQMVTKFRVETSTNGIHWIDQGIYVGPYEPATSVKRKLNQSVIASFVRIYPLEFEKHPSMRLDILVFDPR